MDEKKIYITTPSKYYLDVLSMYGPINAPLPITISAAKKLLYRGIPLFKYDPETKSTEKLTLANLNVPKVLSVKNITSKNDTVSNLKSNETELKLETESSTGIIVSTSKFDPSTLNYDYNEDGTINDESIQWNNYLKAERKLIRSFIVDYNTNILNKEVEDN